MQIEAAEISGSISIYNGSQIYFSPIDGSIHLVACESRILLDGVRLLVWIPVDIMVLPRQRVVIRDDSPNIQSQRQLPS
jgi:hypothetical protein